MAIARLVQTGAELNLAGAELSVVGSATVSSTKARTGTYSFRFALNGNTPMALSFTATAQLRAHLHLNHNGLGGTTDYAYIYRWLSGATQVGAIRYDRAEGYIAAYVGTSRVAYVTAASVGLDATDTWFALGLDLKLAASDGWIYLYKDGLLILSFDGDTLGATGKTTVDQIQYGGGSSGSWQSYAYFDDLYIDDTTGETAPAPVPDRRFALIIPNNNGDKSQFTGSDGDQVNNYQLIDEIPPNGDTDYVKAESADLVDLYAMATVSPPAGFVVSALIPWAYTRKAAAEDDTTVALVVKSSGTEQAGSAQSLGTSYALRWQRWATDPDGAPWTQAKIDDVQVGIKSGGAF